MAVHFTDQSFEQEVLKSKIPVLVDFYAEWCGPCKMVAPTVDELATEYEGKVKIGKVNTEESLDIAQKYGVMSIPTFIIFKDGQVVDQFTGARPKGDFKSKLDALV
jgi:thioredoxin 1